MIQRWTQAYSKDEVLGLMDPLIREWFNSKFRDLAPPQKYAVPLIHQGKNVLITSPTGSGKTLTAFLSIINELLLLGKRGELEDRVYCIYVSPLKALANDIHRNLNEPLMEIYALAHSKSIALPDIRVAVRSGDTSQHKRQSMARKPPHILITTPETLGIVLSTKRFREYMTKVRYVIVDEIHELCNSKRGVFLSLNLERLEELNRDSDYNIVRIGLSATQAPITDIAKYLAGYNDQGKLRDMHIVEITARKSLDMAVITPSKDLNFTPFEIVNAQMYMKLKEYIEQHKTTLIFTNTRSGTEAVVYRLRELGIESIGAHHGSLSKEIRLDVEERMKRGKMKAVASSTSLELGIDIGSIDLVVQIGSPKSIAKGIQRIGRSGHRLHETSKGRIIVFDRDDLIESAVIVNCAYRGKIDRTYILKNNLDVLAQTIVGMSLEKKWCVDEAFNLVRRSYNFHRLKKDDFLAVLSFLGERGKYEHWGIYSKIWYSPEKGTFGIKKGVRQIYNLNIGTIPQESSYDVILYKNNIYVGSLSEKFVERLKKGDIFVLGGRTFEFIRTRGMNVYVIDAMGRRPTVPSWAGEMLPRSFDLSIEVGKFRERVHKMLKSKSQDYILRYLVKNYRVDMNGARTIVNYIKEQSEFTEALSNRAMIPTHKCVVIEGYIDNKRKYNIIFHYCFGRRVNDALSRAYAYKISRKYKVDVGITLSDDNFMLTISKKIPLEDVAHILKSQEFEDILKAALRDTEIFKQRFRHCAVRSFMILRNYKGKEISVRKQHRRAQRVVDYFISDRDFPVIKETYNEILHDAMDMDNAYEVLRGIETGKIEVATFGYNDVPSPMAHNIVLMGYTDLILMEDRTEMLKNLHISVLERVKGLAVTDIYELNEREVEVFFANRKITISGVNDILPALKASTGLHIFRELPPSIYPKSAIPRKDLDSIAKDLIDKGQIVSVYKRPTVVYIHKDDLPVFYTLYGDKTPITNAEMDVLQQIKECGGILPKGVDRDIVRCLERKYLLYRMYIIDDSGRIKYNVRDPEDLRNMSLDPDACAKDLCVRYLYYNGPSTLEELSYALGFSEDEIHTIVDRLVATGTVTEGKFIFGKDTPQYMLTEDYVALKQTPSGKMNHRVSRVVTMDRQEVTVDHETIESYRASRILMKVKGIDDYINRFLGIISPRSIFVRDPEFNIEDLYKRLSNGEIVCGRFIGGLVSFTSREYADLFAKARMRNIFSDTRVFHVYRIIVDCYMNYSGIEDVRHVFGPKNRGFGPTVSEIARELNLEVDEVKDILKVLEKHCFIIRDPEATVGLRKGLVNMNRYLPYIPFNHTVPSPKEIIKSIESKNPEQPKGMDILPESERLAALESLILRFLKGFGPSTIDDITQYLYMDERSIENAIESLRSKGQLHNIYVEGGITYYSVESINKLKIKKASFPKGQDSLLILPFYDPYCFIKRSEMSLRFGVGWISPVIKKGSLIGYIEMSPMGGVLDIRHVELMDKKSLKNDLEHLFKHVIPKWMQYYRQYNIGAVRIRSEGLVNNSISIGKMLESIGYIKCPQGSYALGIVPKFVDSEMIINIVLYHQRIHPSNKFISAIEAIKALGGVRSEFPLALRVRSKVYDIYELARHFRLLGGKLIPSFFMFTLHENILLYKKAKGGRLDKRMEYVLDHIPKSKPVSFNKLKRMVSVSEKELTRIKNYLYDKLFIAKTPNNLYIRIDSSDESKDLKPEDIYTARKEIVYKTLEISGVLKPDEIARMLGHDIPMYEIKRILMDLEDEGKVIKGFFNTNSEDLYYSLPDAFSKPVFKLGQGHWILTNDDPFWLYLAPKINDIFNIGVCHVVMDGIRPIGAFKADIKRYKDSGSRGFIKYLVVYHVVGHNGIKDIITQFARIHNMVIKWDSGGSGKVQSKDKDDQDIIYESVYGEEIYEG